jgi:acyl-CoA synthetase (AMP-forming)/AMP-acid ligase II
VAITTADCVEFATGLFGTLHVGATALPIALDPLGREGGGDRSAAAILKAVSPAMIVAAKDDVPRLRQLVAATGVPSRMIEISPEPVANLAPQKPADLALLQFTSGSTGRPRGVRVSFENLESNIAMIRKWLDWDTQAGGVSWLPLHHDMGLIGKLFVALCAQRDLWQMTPADFLRRPRLWLECLGGGGGSLTAAPTFGYSYAARRLDENQLQGLDFSGWRTAVVGAERVIPQTLHEFAQLLAPFGFRPETLCPAYGMAEATLAVTGKRRGSAPRTVGVAPTEVTIGSSLPSAKEVPFADLGTGSSGDYLVASCGPPLPGLTVNVVGEDGRPLPDGALGEISVAGPSVAAGYHGEGASVSTRFENGRLLTGDAGFLLAGEVFVLGRIADSIKVRGTYVHVEDLEIGVAAALGIPLSRCVVIGIAEIDSDAAAVLIEAESEDVDPEAIRVALLPALGAGVDVRVYVVARHSLVRTTSGKPRRRLLSQMLASGELEAQRLLGFPPAEPVTA